jgi:hypothetical protein
MKKYIEATEITDSEDKDFIQEEVSSDYNATKQKNAKDKCVAKEKSGKTYNYRLHICNHEEGQPCTTESI